MCVGVCGCALGLSILVFLFSHSKPSLRLFSSLCRDNNAGKTPSRLTVLMVVDRWWVTETRGHCVGDANRCMHAYR